MNSFKTYLREHLSILIGAGCGLILGILFLTIGFFPTLLLAALTGLGALLGAFPVIFSMLKAWISKLFSKFSK